MGRRGIVITGGAGFIGSHICEEIYNKFPKSKIIILDKLTYAGNKKYLKNILHSKRVNFYKVDIAKPKTYSKLLNNVDIAINVAAKRRPRHIPVHMPTAPIESTTRSVIDKIMPTGIPTPQ